MPLPAVLGPIIAAIGRVAATTVARVGVSAAARGMTARAVSVGTRLGARAGGRAGARVGRNFARNATADIVEHTTSYAVNKATQAASRATTGESGRRQQDRQERARQPSDQVQADGKRQSQTQQPSGSGGRGSAPSSSDQGIGSKIGAILGGFAKQAASAGGASGPAMSATSGIVRETAAKATGKAPEGGSSGKSAEGTAKPAGGMMGGMADVVSNIVAKVTGKSPEASGASGGATGAGPGATILADVATAARPVVAKAAGVGRNLGGTINRAIQHAIPDQPIRDVDNQEVLDRGNFGDMMAGKTSMSEQRKVIEGEEQLAAKKAKLASMVAKLTPLMAALAGAAAGATKAIHSMGAALVERRREIAQYDGGLAAATARLDVNRLKRDIDRARSTSFTGRAQTQSQNALERELAPFKTLAENLTNAVSTTANYAAASALKITRLVSAVDEIVALLGIANEEDPKKDDIFLQQVKRVQEAAAKPKGRRKR